MSTFTCTPDPPWRCVTGLERRHRTRGLRRIWEGKIQQIGGGAAEHKSVEEVVSTLGLRWLPLLGEKGGLVGTQVAPSLANLSVARAVVLARA